jgi:arylsulfatase A-like enzyme
MKEAEVTLAEILKEHGYTSGHFGKWHLGTLTTGIKDSNRGRPGETKHYSPPWDNGFDVCFSTEAKVPTYWHEDAYSSYGTYYWTGPEKMVEASEVSGDDSRLIMDRVLPFIRDAVEGGKSFLSVIWFHSPHLPVISAPPYTNGYKDHKDYYGCITALDEQMGRLRSTLRELGAEQNTMIWFCSDNGPEGDQSAPGRTGGLRGRKRSLYEGGVRVPGLLVWPDRIRAPRTVSMPCCTSDYFPTVLDALSIRFHRSDSRPFDGISLMPVIFGSMTDRPGPIAFQSGKQISLTDNRHKIYSKDRGQTFELYDLIDDPVEQNNIAENHPEVVKRMKKTLEAWQASCKMSLQLNDYAK